MHARLIILAAALSATLTLSAAAHGASTLRVGNQVLTSGDSAVRVTELLGKPSHKFRGRRSRHASARSHGRYRSVVVLTDQARGEKWQYRRDDHVTTVTIVDGKVVDIDDHRI